MPAELRDLSALSRPERTALAGELLGAGVELDAHPGYPAGAVGTLVDETLSTFVVRLPGSARPRRFAKSGARGRISLSSGELPLNGDLLRVRPEDRTKRLLVGGPRRVR
jgi:RNase P/RNase MRP subunit p29